MMNSKYIIATLLAVSCTFSSLTFANEGASQYSAPIITPKFQFTAVLENGDVYMKWNRFDSFSDSALQYYKVVRSSSNASPVYPDDWYIKYDTNMAFTSYTDTEPKNGINYYRVCAITENLNRFCSNVVKITSKPTVTIMPVKTTPVVVNETKNEMKTESVLDKKVAELVSGFEKKLNELYGDNTEKKTAVTNLVISRLEALKKADPRKEKIVNMVITGLKNLLAKNDIQDIADILNIQ